MHLDNFMKVNCDCCVTNVRVCWRGILVQAFLWGSVQVVSIGCEAQFLCGVYIADPIKNK